MFSDIITAGGPGLLIPVVLFALVFYAARGLFGLHGRRGQHRREFLEHWDPARTGDDLWLEVTIRHLHGTHLPAHVIRTALAQPNTSQALMELSELWPLLHYHPDTRQVSWKHRRHRSARSRALVRHWPMVRYFLFAFAGVGSGYLAVKVSGLTQWVFAFFAATMAVCAFLTLLEADADKVAATVGEAWIGRINDRQAVIEAMPAGDEAG